MSRFGKISKINHAIGIMALLPKISKSQKINNLSLQKGTILNPPGINVSSCQNYFIQIQLKGSALWFSAM